MPGERWITFDCFGTLVDWQTGFRGILRDSVGDRADELVEAYHTTEPEVERERPGDPYKMILKEAIGRAAAKTGMSLADPGVLAERWGELPVFADTKPSLDALHADGWRLGVLTNCDNDLFEATRKGFPVKLDMVVTAEEVGNYKPDFAHFTEFERRSGVERQHWVHAACSWTHDMRPARALGLRRIWVDREKTGHDASIVTARVTDLTGLVAVLRAPG